MRASFSREALYIYRSFPSSPLLLCLSFSLFLLLNVFSSSFLFNLCILGRCRPRAREAKDPFALRWQRSRKHLRRRRSRPHGHPFLLPSPPLLSFDFFSLFDLLLSFSLFFSLFLSFTLFSFFCRRFPLYHFSSNTHLLQLAVLPSHGPIFIDFPPTTPSSHSSTPRAVSILWYARL